MKELQVMQGLDHSTERMERNASERKKRRKRKRRIRKIRAILIRIAVIFSAAVMLCLVFAGGKFLVQRLAEKIAGKNETISQNDDYDTEVFAETGPLVVLDAGHGGTDQGTSSRKMIEKDINLKVAKLVEKELEENGIRVLLTREDDSRVKLEQRAALANEKEAALFVSIHCNYNEDSTAIEGMEFYYQTGSDKGKAAAEALSSSFDEVKDVVNRGTREEDFHVLRETHMPAVLVELGFLSNASDRKKLNQKDYQQILAQCIAETIVESEMFTGDSEEPDTEL